ncbi:hypothetical protein B14911_13362 [Bacillus sp. NRRL B-14911]|nr:hypothetical protein B14911_13362 [Bacillus sp. NRRL B-14911]
MEIAKKEPQGQVPWLNFERAAALCSS